MKELMDEHVSQGKEKNQNKRFKIKKKNQSSGNVGLNDMLLATMSFPNGWTHSSSEREFQKFKSITKQNKGKTFRNENLKKKNGGPRRTHTEMAESSNLAIGTI